MKTPSLCATFASCLAAALLASCGGSQLPVGAPQNREIAHEADHGQSWMMPEAKNSDLLYVSDGGNDVYVFSYPSGTLVGTLTGFNGADGECVDKSGNIFITNAEGYVDEYRHGGARPFTTIGDYGFFPLDCAVDPITGNLAVTNYPGLYGVHGNVAVYKKARGTPKLYDDANFNLYYACGYDNKGGLYVDGVNAKGAVVFAELPNGSGTFTNITLSRQFQYPGAVLWDGKYVAVGTENGDAIYRFEIDGSSGTVVGRSLLGGVVNSGQALFWLEGDRVIVPFGTGNGAKSNVGFWKYPAGGPYLKRIEGFGGRQLFGVTVSLAPAK